MSTVTIKNNRYTVDSLYQWDRDQVLQINGLSLPTIPEIHFTNDAMDRAIVSQATMTDAGVISANIPNSLLQKPSKISAYVCVYENGTFKSLYKIVIPVTARNKPGDYSLVNDPEVYSFTELENKINNIYKNVDAKISGYEESFSESVETSAKKSYRGSVIS